MAAPDEVPSLADFEAEAQALLQAWIEGQKACRVLTAPEHRAGAELSGWLELLGPAASGESWAATELYRLIASYARGLGLAGRPTSVALVQFLLLQDLLAERWPKHKGFGEIVRELCRIVVDAQTLGQAERLVAHHQSQLRACSPVLRIGPSAVLGFLVGAMLPDNIDAIFGRLMREAVGVGAATILLDVRGAEADDDTLHRTLFGYVRSEVGRRVELVVTGLRDPEATRRAVDALGADLELGSGKLRFEGDVSLVLDELLTRRAPFPEND